MKTIRLGKRITFIWLSVWLIFLSISSTKIASATDAISTNIRAVRIESELSLFEKQEKDEIPKVVFRGSDARHQCLVTGTDSKGLEVDLTRNATYSFEPEGIASIDSFGQIAPLKNGLTTLSVNVEDVGKAVLEVEVTNWDDNPEVSFPNQVVPIFTKLGCNSGGCHGKAPPASGRARCPGAVCAWPPCSVSRPA